MQPTISASSLARLGPRQARPPQLLLLLLLLLLLPAGPGARAAPDEPEAAAGLEDELAEAEQAALAKPFDYHASMPVITKRELAAAVRQAAERLGHLQAAAGHQAQAGSAGWLASAMMHHAAPMPEDGQLRNQSRQALISELATRQLQRAHKLDRWQTQRGLPLISVDSTELGGANCGRQARTFACLAERYRSLSGHCNNVQNAHWGSARSALVRYAPARYADHVSRPLPAATKAAGSGGQRARLSLLPSARAVSLALAQRPEAGPELAASSHLTTMLTFFGQFVFNDVARVAPGLASMHPSSCPCARAPAGSQQQGEPAANQQLPDECAPIEWRNSTSGQPPFCLEYARSAPAARAGCNLGARDQLNLVSSYLDASGLYGSDQATGARLRTFAGGRLRSQRQPAAATSGSAGELLPAEPEVAGLEAQQQAAGNAWNASSSECANVARMRPGAPAAPRCFEAGDARANANLGLALMHTIWLREHNQLASRLSKLNPHWDDERLYQEARRLIIGQLQHITYAEFLPAVLGPESVRRHNLSLLAYGYAAGYDLQANAGASNELATAVFPFILATLPSELERYSDRLEMLGSVSVARTFMDGAELHKRHRFGQYLAGMMSQSALEPASARMPVQGASGPARNRRQLAPATANNNNNNNNNNSDADGEPEAAASDPGVLGPAVDLVALAIHQGRDHGLRGYLYWREACALRPRVRSWQDLHQLMDGSAVEALERVYGSVRQLDLYLALLERPLEGAAVGPTFACLLGRQFQQLKQGDRFWYENDLPQSGFSPEQLEQIRQTSLARLVCRNSQQALTFIQPAPMLASDPYLNAYQYCSNAAMGELELEPWREPVTSASQMPLATSGAQLEQQVRRLTRHHAPVIARELRRARRQANKLTERQMLRLRRARLLSTSAGHARHMANHRAGYRHLVRTKRQVLALGNQSLVFELATSGVLRSLASQARDRERAQPLEAEARHFLATLERAQLTHLFDNWHQAGQLAELVSTAGNAFLTSEQRERLRAMRDPLLSQPLPVAATTTSSSTSGAQELANCQDDDRQWPCDHTSPFRTITGWCNNLKRPKFGQSFTQHDRILPSAYQDGLGSPRVLDWSGNASLPSPRLVSTTMHADVSGSVGAHARYSLALMQFGQFGVDHDLTRTPFSVAPDGSLLDCSACNSRQSLHRDCLPIEIPAQDPHFESPKARELLGKGRKCLHFVRSINGQVGLGPRQQLNALTSYLDGSNVYGSDNCEAKSLRAFVGGQLNSSAAPAGPAGSASSPRELLPLTRANLECVTPGRGACFHAGDQRASEQPGLSAIHTVFLRLHNTLAGELASLNEHWKDERLYQEARRIVVAILQRITYGEFAPRLLGLDYMSRFELLLKQVGYTPAASHYDEACSANVLNEFSAAAFRMGHSLIRNAFPLLDRNYKPIGKAFQLRKAFFNSARLLSEPHLVDTVLRGIVSTPIEQLDESVSDELTNHLFERPQAPFSGMDLVSLNIQRARDHGLAPYNAYRPHCNLSRARTFDDLAGEIPAKLVKRLASLYAHVDDVDLFTGGMSERPVHGGLIGPTLACIIGLQLARAKHCDRFWHETDDPWTRFSLGQLAELRKLSLARVLCQESDSIDSIQRQAMDVPDKYLNPRVPCNTLAAMNLEPWREQASRACLLEGRLKLELGASRRLSPCKSCTCTLEGPSCRSVRVDCARMSPSALAADRTCLVQCAWMLDLSNQLL